STRQILDASLEEMGMMRALALSVENRPTPSQPRLVAVPDVSTVARALDGEEVALERLVDHLSPIVHRRVVRVLRRRRPSATWERIRQEAQDFTQEILIVLFSGPRLLADWRPERGLTLESFVDMVARRRTLSALGVLRRDPWQEETAEVETFDGPSREPDPERRLLSIDRLDRLLTRLQAVLQPDTWHIFELIWIQGASIAEVAEVKGLRPDAIYARVSRIRKRVRRLDDDQEATS
ncbi:MAG: sigma-70 family RNA polymerase sigma factor, partial [Acidobacteriota bacterium]